MRKRLEDRRRHTDAGYPPGANLALGLQGLKCGDDLFGILAPRRRKLVAELIAMRKNEVIFTDIAMEDEDVGIIDPHGLEAGIERRLKRCRC